VPGAVVVRVTKVAVGALTEQETAGNGAGNFLAERSAVGRQVRGDGDQVDHHDRHQYYGGHAPGIAFQGERLAVFPGELLVGERRTMSSGKAAR
jgi:hypothetical protein